VPALVVHLYDFEGLPAEGGRDKIDTSRRGGAEVCINVCLQKGEGISEDGCLLEEAFLENLKHTDALHHCTCVNWAILIFFFYQI
jgi:hypothetical protein